MKDKIVYFLRHGETVTNAAHIYAGQSDTPLNEKGFAQAKALAPYLQHVAFDKVYCSDLQRARYTAAMAIPHMECEYTTQIREIDVGNLAGRSVAECIEEFGEPFIQNRARLDYSIYGGESHEQLDARIADFMHKLENDDHAVIGVVCHGGVIKSVRRYIIGDCKGMSDPENCSICKITYKDGKWTLNKWNVTVKV